MALHFFGGFGMLFKNSPNLRVFLKDLSASIDLFSSLFPGVRFAEKKRYYGEREINYDYLTKFCVAYLDEKVAALSFP
jgi:hypothetical protein